MRHAVILCAVVSGLALGLPPQALGQRVRAGGPAPDFALPILDGDSATLIGLRGHPVVLKFWASWCPSCRTEMPELGAARAANAAAGVEVLAINGEETPERIHRYLREIGLTTPLEVLVDRKGHVTQRFGVLSLPTTIFIDSAGVIHVIHRGPITSADFEAGLRTILDSYHPEE
jgi:peroxiredoxin